MARPLRIEFNGAYYHVLSRGNNRFDIFKSKDDYIDFLDLLGELSERFSVLIYAYVLMGNHYHLLLQTQKSNLSRAMQWLGTAYTRRFNIRHSQTGHLFQGRFKSILVEDDSYFINLSCYIHCNPLRAGMVKHLGDYRWSSYPHYAYGKKRPEWLIIDRLLSYFGNDPGCYRDKVKEYAKESESIWEKVKYGCIFGSQAFIDHIRDKYLSDKPDKELPQLNHFLKNRDPGETVSEAAAFLDCDINMLKASGRLTGENCDKRDILIRLLWETGNFSNSQIGEYFGLSYSSVSRRLSRVAGCLRSDGDNCLKELHRLLNAKFKV